MKKYSREANIKTKEKKCLNQLRQEQKKKNQMFINDQSEFNFLGINPTFPYPIKSYEILFILTVYKRLSCGMWKILNEKYSKEADIKTKEKKCLNQS